MNNSEISGSRQLMKQILEVRYKSSEETIEYCRALLGIAEPIHDTYACAFAHTYLADGFLVLNDSKGCSFHLTKGTTLCREYKYDDLMLVLCNLAGLYYGSQSDEGKAISYYLEGLHLAEKLQNRLMEKYLHNNIGMSFAKRLDWETSKKYFEKVAQISESMKDSTDDENMTSCLTNYAEVCIRIGELKTAQDVLKKCDKICPKGLRHKLRLSAAWLEYYGAKGDKKIYLEKLEELINLGLLEFDDVFFISFMLVEICENMIDLEIYTHLERFLAYLNTIHQSNDTLSSSYSIECLQIKYWEKIGNEQELAKSLKRFYEITNKMKAEEDKMRAQSMLSKIEIARSQLEEKEMYTENLTLENATQIDELTGLFNRRYMKKLISKTLQSKEVVLIGYIMMDIDFFKQYNDYYGHFGGDKALKTVAKILSENAKKDIFVSRYGGDEFVCLCINVTEEQIEEYIAKARKELEKLSITHEKSKCSNRLTLSIGYSVVTICDNFQGTYEVLDRADRALYEAKNAGRNSVAKI